MIETQYRDLFGKWRDAGKTFDSLDAARAWCIDMADATGIAYRVLQDDEPVELVDLEREFFELGRDRNADRADEESP